MARGPTGRRFSHDLVPRQATFALYLNGRSGMGPEKPMSDRGNLPPRYRRISARDRHRVRRDRA